MKNPLLGMTAAAVSFVALTSAAQARSTYDGSWDLLFVTQRGACDPTYNFSVNITDGIVAHPNLVRFRGYVARSGAVRASVDSRAIPAAAAGTAIREARAVQGTGPLSGTSAFPLMVDDATSHG